jgi:ADP-ribosylglycohydrolase
LPGGAVGDALRAPLEFLSLERIHRRFGPDGIRDYVPAYGRRVAITDEGLLPASVRLEAKGICHIPGVVHHAHLR